MDNERLEKINNEMNIFIDELEKICAKDKIDIFDILTVTHKKDKINNDILQICLDNYSNKSQSSASE